MVRKKKDTTAEDSLVIATDAKKAVKKKAKPATEPVVVKGSHLTVTTYPDGRTELVWDDEALAREVKEATEAYELSQLKPAVRAKAATRKKKAQ